MSDELTVRLRELAETAEALPPGSGAEVRATAGRRRRRRRTTAAVAGGCVAAGLAAVLTLNVASHGTGQRPSTAASSAPSASVAPDVTVDLSRRVLTFDGRELPISAGTVRHPTPSGLMTVTFKSSAKVASGQTVGLGTEYDLKLAWVMELSPIEANAPGDGDDPGTGSTGSTGSADSTADGTGGTAGSATGATRGTNEVTEGTEGTGATDTGDGTDTGGRASEKGTRSPALSAVWIAAITHNEKAPGNYDATNGWIGLLPKDARWLYERLPEGAIVEIRNPGPTPASPPPSTRTPTP